jgi:hypothetical protein
MSPKKHASIHKVVTWGRRVGVWLDPRIFKQVILTWLARTLDAKAVEGQTLTTPVTIMVANSLQPKTSYRHRCPTLAVDRRVA